MLTSLLFSGDPSMEKEPEVIRQEMDETRNALTDKIQLLEQTVVETVQEASSNVKETVEAVKGAVEETVQNVKQSVTGTVDSVKETFSLNSQIQQRPWLVMAGAAGLGFVVGYALYAPETERGRRMATPRPRSRGGNGSHKEHFTEPSPRPETPEESGVFHSLYETFEPEIHQLKGLAIGTLAGIVRDMISNSVPETMSDPLSGVVDTITTKLGGQPTKRGSFSHFAQHEPSQRDDPFGERRGFAY